MTSYWTLLTSSRTDTLREGQLSRTAWPSASCPAATVGGIPGRALWALSQGRVSLRERHLRRRYRPRVVRQPPCGTVAGRGQLLASQLGAVSSAGTGRALPLQAPLPGEYDRRGRRLRAPLRAAAQPGMGRLPGKERCRQPRRDDHPPGSVSARAAGIGSGRSPEVPDRMRADRTALLPPGA